MENEAPVIGKDIPWSTIDGQVCRVLEFSPFGKVENGKVSNLSISTPYASLTVECSKLPQNGILSVFHKTDFLSLTNAFEQKKEENEVLVIWTTKHYKNFFYKIISSIMPKLTVWVCQKGAYDLMTDRNYKLELSGEARFLEEKPIIEYKPEVID